jgi:phosphomannomutase
MRDKLPSLLNTPEARFPCTENRKFAIIAEIKERLRAAGAEVNAIDGVRVQTADGWWLLRASNTQDLLVARCESTTAAGLGRLKQSLAEALQAAGEPPPQW